MTHYTNNKPDNADDTEILPTDEHEEYSENNENTEVFPIAPAYALPAATKPTNFSPLALFMEFGIFGRLMILVVSAVGIWATARYVFEMTNIASTMGLNQFVIMAEGLSAFLSVIFLMWLILAETKHFALPDKILLAWLACRMVLIILGMLGIWVQGFFGQEAAMQGLTVASNSIDENGHDWFWVSPPPPQFAIWTIPLSSALAAIAMGIPFLITYALKKKWPLGSGKTKLMFMFGISFGSNFLMGATIWVGATSWAVAIVPIMIWCLVGVFFSIIIQVFIFIENIPLSAYLFVSTPLLYFVGSMSFEFIRVILF
ncbi:MAG: hypothetical protein FWG65_11640 [Turicibacter sp.]|nr:hypothetical protein [Turicibacter sp.]